MIRRESRRCRLKRRTVLDVRLALAFIILGLGFVARGWAQTSTPATATHATSQEEDPHRLAVNPLTGMVTSSASNYHPLALQERWKLYWKQNYWSMGAYTGPLAAALVLDQARGTPYEWGGGFPGYGRRLASRMGSAIVQGTVQAPVAVLLREDVRYIGSDQQGFKRRAAHAVLYSFLTDNNQGHRTLNIANLGGYYAASAISTLWLPGNNNVGSHTLSDGSLQIAVSIPVNMLQEFWPDIRRRVFHRQ